MENSLTKRESKENFAPFADGVYRIRINGIVNAYAVDTPERGAGSWVLIDTGTPMSGGVFDQFIAKNPNRDSKPAAIVLTHGHVDHAGLALTLAERWQIPIYAHHLEMPYLTGKSNYPPQDPNVEGAGLFAGVARLFPYGACDLGGHVLPIHAENSLTGIIGDEAELPILPDWKILHTPGHTAGHISLWREADRTLIVGDAFVTVNIDSLPSLLTEKPQFYRPPAYFTPNWEQAHASIHKLADLAPNNVGSGHGAPITGANTAQDLQKFAHEFRPPRYGRYAHTPAIIDETGVVSLPPPKFDPLKAVVIGGVAIAGIYGLARLARPRR